MGGASESPSTDLGGVISPRLCARRHCLPRLWRKAAPESGAICKRRPADRAAALSRLEPLPQPAWDLEAYVSDEERDRERWSVASTGVSKFALKVYLLFNNWISVESPVTLIIWQAWY